LTNPPVALELFYFDIFALPGKTYFPEKKRQIEYPKQTPFVNRCIQYLSFIFNPAFQWLQREIVMERKSLPPMRYVGV